MVIQYRWLTFSDAPDYHLNTGIFQRFLITTSSRFKVLISVDGLYSVPYFEKSVVPSCHINDNEV